MGENPISGNGDRPEPGSPAWNRLVDRVLFGWVGSMGWNDGMVQMMQDIRFAVRAGVGFLGAITLALVIEGVNQYFGLWGSAHAASITTQILTGGKH